MNPICISTHLLLISAFGISSNAQSFLNPSFETGLTNHPNYDAYDGSAFGAVPDSWNLFSNDNSSPVTGPYWSSGLGTNAVNATLYAAFVSAGNSSIVLNSYNADPANTWPYYDYYEAGISQVVTDMSIGAAYEVTFDAGLASVLVATGDSIGFGAPAFLDVYVGGSLLTSFPITNTIEGVLNENQTAASIDGSMQEYGFTFVAAASSAEIGFRSRIDSEVTASTANGGPYVGMVALDNLNITPVPEPSSLLLSGAAVMAGLLRRRVR